MPKVQANGIEIYYEQHGWDKDAEVLVLSNGVLMSTASWAMLVPVLAKHYRVLVYDCRGMWQSEHPAGPYSMEQHADDLAARISKFFESSPVKDVEKNVKALLASGFARLDLVPRAEFEVQAQVLLKTREKLEALERRLAELEARLGASDERQE